MLHDHDPVSSCDTLKWKTDASHKILEPCIGTKAVDVWLRQLLNSHRALLIRLPNPPPRSVPSAPPTPPGLGKPASFFLRTAMEVGWGGVAMRPPSSGSPRFRTFPMT